MHELSIAYSVVETVENAALEAGASRVSAVRLKIGRLSGVVIDALRFSFEIAAENTLLAGARLEIEDVSIKVRCAPCQHDFTLKEAHIFRCPQCGEPTPNIIEGRELDIISVELAEETEKTEKTENGKSANS